MTGCVSRGGARLASVEHRWPLNSKRQKPKLARQMSVWTTTGHEGLHPSTYSPAEGLSNKKTGRSVCIRRSVSTGHSGSQSQGSQLSPLKGHILQGTVLSI